MPDNNHWGEVELTSPSAHRDKRKADFARSVGVEPAHVKTIRLELNELLQAGSLWDVDIKGTSLLFASVSWKEYGVDETSDSRAKKYTRGSKPLFAAELYKPIQSLEVRFRQTLQRFGYKIEGFDHYTWIPATAFNAWMQRHKELVAEFEDRKARLIAAHAGAVENMRDESRLMALRAYRAARASADVELTQSRDEYVAEVVTRAVAQLPTIEDLRSRLIVALHPAIIEDTRAIAESELAAQSVRLEREELRLKEEQVRVMRMAQMEHARSELATMSSPWDEVIHGFGAKLHAAVLDVVATIENHGYLPGKTAEKAKGLRELYNILSITRNGNIEAALDALEAAMNTRPVGKINNKELSYDPAAVKAALEKIAEITIDSAKHMTQVKPQEWEDLEI